LTPVSTDVSRFDVAVPFLLSALLLALGPFVGLAIEHRLKGEFTSWAEEMGQDIGELDDSLQPAAHARAAGWACDAAQLVGTVVAPATALLLLKPDLGSALALLYLVTIVGAFVAFLAFTFLVPVDKYGTRRIVWIFSPLAVIGVGVNAVAAGVAAWLIGPE
jgi:hypothetical protein